MRSVEQGLRILTGFFSDRVNRVLATRSVSEAFFFEFSANKNLGVKSLVHRGDPSVNWIVVLLGRLYSNRSAHTKQPTNRSRCQRRSRLLANQW
jgi:hypothetical protein